MSICLVAIKIAGCTWSAQYRTTSVNVDSRLAADILAGQFLWVHPCVYSCASFRFRFRLGNISWSRHTDEFLTRLTVCRVVGNDLYPNMKSSSNNSSELGQQELWTKSVKMMHITIEILSILSKESPLYSCSSTLPCAQHISQGSFLPNCSCPIWF